MTPPRVIAFAGNSLPLEAIGPPSFSMPSILSFLAKTFQSTLGISTRHAMPPPTTNTKKHLPCGSTLPGTLSSENRLLQMGAMANAIRAAPHRTARSLACMGCFVIFPPFLLRSIHAFPVSSLSLSRNRGRNVIPALPSASKRRSLSRGIPDHRCLRSMYTPKCRMAGNFG
ncbi:hypothetical protein LZ31DRAFT_557745 [Colletotrichum somersetense]|nr:hypothetical protein LZ31DRAFT_557745 [Colletotrichum somersetense]